MAGFIRSIEKALFRYAEGIDELAASFSKKEPANVDGIDRMLLVPAAILSIAGCTPDYEDSQLSKERWKVKPLTERLTTDAKSEEEKVTAVVQWAENNLFHYADFGQGNIYTPAVYGDIDATTYYGFKSISIDDIFRERAVGCHLASGVVITMLRSIGISANYVNIDGHGLTYVPSINRYIHGDHVAELSCIPAEELLLREDELNYWLQHPGFPASELGLDPKYGMISQGYYAFVMTMHQKYKSILKLQRDQHSLYIFGAFEKSADYFELLSDRCSEYNLRLEKKDLGVQSDYIPIEGIEELQ